MYELFGRWQPYHLQGSWRLRKWECKDKLGATAYLGRHLIFLSTNDIFPIGEDNMMVNIKGIMSLSLPTSEERG